MAKNYSSSNKNSYGRGWLQLNKQEQNKFKYGG